MRVNETIAGLSYTFKRTFHATNVSLVDKKGTDLLCVLVVVLFIFGLLHQACILIFTAQYCCFWLIVKWGIPILFHTPSQPFYMQPDTILKRENTK